MRSVPMKVHALCITLVATLFLSGCTPPAEDLPETADPGPSFSGRASTVDTSGAFIELGGVTVNVPAGSTADGSDIDVSIGDEIGEVENEFASELFGEPVRVDHSVELSSTVTITWDVSGLEPHQQHLSLVRWDEKAGVWVPSSEPVIVADGVATADVQQFSTVTWTSAVSQIWGEFTGKRIAEPVCSGQGLPDWVSDTVLPDETNSNAALRACFQTDENDSSLVTVRVANNRTFSQLMQVNDAADDLEWRWTGDEKYDITATVYNAAHTVLDDGDTMILPPLSTQAVGVGRPSSPAATIVRGEVSVGWQSVFTDLIAMGMDSVSIGGTQNPALDALIQVLYECGVKQIVLPQPNGSEVVRVVAETIGGCASEIVRPDSEFGMRFENLSREMIARGGRTQTGAIQMNRLARSVASKFAILKAGDVAFYASDQFANALVGPLHWQISGRPVPQTLGSWTPTCSNTATDSQLLFDNVAGQDQFADKSKLLWEFDTWEAATVAGTEPLRSCSTGYRASLAAKVAGNWGDKKAAAVVAEAIIAMNAPADVGNTKVVKIDPWSDQAIVGGAEPGGSADSCSASSVFHPEFVTCSTSAQCITDSSGAKGLCPTGYGLDSWVLADVDMSDYDLAPGSELVAIKLQLVDGSWCSFHGGSGPKPPDGIGGFSGSCAGPGEQSGSLILWQAPEADTDTTLNGWTFMPADSSGYLRVAVGLEGQQPDYIGVETVYY
jgi:hypothetical protein